MAAQRKPKVDRPDTVDGGAPLDGEALRKALGETYAGSGAPPSGRGPDARGLRERAEAAIAGDTAEAPHESGSPWSLRRQFLFITLASALCWAVVLVPFVLVF